MSDLVWEEPPAKPVVLATLEEQLKSRPGVWAKVAEGEKVPTSRTAGELARQGFEVGVYPVEDEPAQLKVYARWVEAP